MLYEIQVNKVDKNQELFKKVSWDVINHKYFIEKFEFYWKVLKFDYKKIN